MSAQLHAHRRALAVGFWVVWLTIGLVVNATTVLDDFARSGLSVEVWEPWVWEGSSHVMIGLLIPLVLWIDRRLPLEPGRWRRSLIGHALATVPFSLLHVGGMVGLRKLVYTFHDSRYDFGDFPTEFFYEYRKDLTTYAFILLVFYVWRRLTAAPSASDATTPPAEGPDETDGDAAGAPSFFVSRKFGREYVVDPAEIVWIEAAGNYVNLHCDGGVFPVRGSMTAMEKALDPKRFVRIHRSTIVDVGRIEAIEPLESGDCTLRLRSGGELRLSRRYRARLKAVFG